MTITIRPRTPADLPDTASLLQRVHTTSGYPVEGVPSPLLFLNPHPTTTLAAWVAVDTTTTSIVGHVMLTTSSFSPPHPAIALAGLDASRTVVLGRLFVDEGVRGRGVGEGLVGVAVEWAAGQEGGRRRAVLNVLEKDGAAVRLYERLGWVRVGEGVYGYGCGDGGGREWRQWFYVGP